MSAENTQSSETTHSRIHLVRTVTQACQVVIFWIAKVHRAAKFGVFCCVLTPFRRFDTITAEKEIAQEPGELIYGPRRHTAKSPNELIFITQGSQ